MDSAPTTALRDVEQVHAALSRLRLEDLSFGQVLQQVADLAVASVPGADVVSVTVVEGDQASTAATTGDLALRLDQRQYELGSGPCLDAVRHGQVVRLPDLAVEARYPDLLPSAREAGVRAITSVPLTAPPRTAAGLNVYTVRAPDADGRVAAAVQEFTDRAGAAVANAALVASVTRVADELRRAMTTRAVIEQAKGLLVARLGCSPERAFELLAEQSQHTNRKLRDVAVELVRDAQSRAHPRPPG